MNTESIIEKLKKHLNIEKDIDLANFLGVKQSTLATWKRRGTPNLKLILSKCNDIDFNKLLKDEYSGVNMHQKQAVEEQKRCINEAEIVEIMSKGGNTPIILIPEKASAGYGKGFGNDLHREYRIMQFMDYKNGNQYRCFEISGDSMEPTIQSGDYVLCERIEQQAELKEGIVYILCFKDTILCKRLEISKGQLILHSENQKYSPKPIEKQEVTEIWKVIWVHRELK